MREGDVVFCGQSVKLVRRGAEGSARFLLYFLGDRFGKSFRAVQPRADGGTAEREAQKPVFCGLDLCETTFRHASPTADFLREGDRDGVLQMGATDGHDPFALLFDAAEGVDHLRERGFELFRQGEIGGDVQGGREGVIGALRAVDVVVRVQEPLSRDLVAPIRDHFVEVHVGLGAAARLPYREREMPLERPREDLVRHGDDQRGALVVQ